MKWFKCYIEGENFPGELVNDDKLIGFFITRFVQADSPEEAENIALGRLKDEESLKLPTGASPSAIAKVYFGKIAEVSEKDVPTDQPGFTFFPMENLH